MKFLPFSAGVLVGSMLLLFICLQLIWLGLVILPKNLANSKSDGLLLVFFSPVSLVVLAIKSSYGFFEIIVMNSSL